MPRPIRTVPWSSRVVPASLRGRLIAGLLAVILVSITSQILVYRALTYSTTEKIGVLGFELATELGIDVGQGKTAEKDFIDRVARNVGENRDVIVTALVLPLLAKTLREKGIENPSFEIALSSGPDEGSTLRLTGRPGQKPVDVNGEAFAQAMEQYVLSLAIGSSLILFLGIAICVSVTVITGRSLERLAHAAQALGDGQLGIRVEEHGPREVVSTMRAFNEMSSQLQRMLREREQIRMRQHLAELGEMATAVVHSLRNPLQVLGLTVHELSQTETPKLAEELAATARRSIARVDRVLSSFLSLAVRDDLDPSQLDIRSVLSDVVLECVQACRGRVRLRYSPPTKPLELHAVSEEIRVIVHVVLTNAIEAAPSGSEVEVDTRVSEGRTVVQIADRGPGVPEKLRKRSAAAIASTKPTGAGVGLFLARRILESRYNGQLSLHARQGGGTVGVIEFSNRQESLND